MGKKAQNTEESFEIINNKFLSKKNVIRTKENLLQVVEEKVVEELHIMGYIKFGGTIINGKATITWSITKKWEQEENYKTNKINLNNSDKELIKFYNRY